MKLKVTMKDLAAAREDLRRIAVNHPGLRLILLHKVERFYKDNQMLFKILDSRMEETIKRWVSHDENGSPRTEMRDGIEQYIFPSDEARASYLEQVAKIMSMEAEIVV